MKNPNGYGSVTKLSGNRRRPFWVRKTVGWNEKGHPIYETIGYCATREEGNMLLAEYNRNPYDINQAKITLEELYQLWLQKKSSKLGENSVRTLKSAYRHIEPLRAVPYKDIKAVNMQDTIDNCGLSYSTQQSIKSLWYHLDKLALELDISSKNYSSLITTAPVPETSRLPFTDDEINRVWELYNKPSELDVVSAKWVDTVLILLYTGLRISEFTTIKIADVDLEERTIKGGIKTKAGKNRIIPIHSAILPMIKARYDPDEKLLIRGSSRNYRRIFEDIMKQLQMVHTPHECRHTFETRLDSAGANRKCIDMMMGHASRDVGNRVYNHKTIEELRTAIELLK